MKRAIAPLRQGFRPSRSRGQCFLTDERAIARVVAAIGPGGGDTFLEIGGGGGELTFPVAEACARLITLESDPRLATRLRAAAEKNGAAGDGARIEILERDAVRADYGKLLEERQLERVRVCGNLPYSVAAPILLKLLATPERFTDLTLMFQNEVAQRLVAKPATKAYGYLSVVAQQAAGVQLLFRLAAESFRPRPRVVSALVRFRLRHENAPDVGDTGFFRALVRGLLTHRRKTIGNNVKYLRGSAGPKRAAQLEGALDELGLDPKRRAETLSVEEFAALSRICASPR